MVTRACHKPGVSAKKTWKHRREAGLISKINSSLIRVAS